MNKKHYYSLLIRYSIIFLLGLSNFYLIYLLLTPPTLLASKTFLSLFGDAILLGNTILFEMKAIEIIPACVAGSAYYLLTILNLSTRNIKLNKRAYALFFSIAIFFIINLLRIVTFSLLSKDLFNTLHLLTWHIFSTLFVVGIWFLTVYIFKIKSIPIYDDFKFLVKSLKNSKRTKKNKNSGKKNSKRNR